MFVACLYGVSEQQRKWTQVEASALVGEKVLAAAEAHQQVAQVLTGIFLGAWFQPMGMSGELVAKVLGQ